MLCDICGETCELDNMAYVFSTRLFKPEKVHEFKVCECCFEEFEILLINWREYYGTR